LAQFSSLSTNKDGSVLYFSTPLKEKNTAEPTYGKIFSIDSSGLHLLYSRDITAQDKACSNAYNLTDYQHVFRRQGAGGLRTVLLPER
jgi:hypothetical protein